MLPHLEKSALKTILYADLFNYPLLENEIWRFLITEGLDEEEIENFRKEDLKKSLKNLNGFVKQKNNMYFIAGREKNIFQRIQRNKESRKKLKKAFKIVSKLYFIPTIFLIGISGALAMGNSHAGDDIDIFIVAKRKTLWSTRLFIIAVLLLTDRYRRRHDKNAVDKICLNMLVDQDYLIFPENRKDLYTAHEIIQFIPVFQRHKTYKKFIGKNLWTKKLLPNAHCLSIPRSVDKSTDWIFSIFFEVLEKVAEKLQRFSIDKHKTVETVSSGFAAFHPMDYRQKTLSVFKKRLKEYGI